MKTVDVSRARTTVSKLLEQARDEDLLVRDAEGREYVLVAIDQFDEEIMRTRKNKKLMKLLDARGRQTKAIPWTAAKKQLDL